MASKRADAVKGTVGSQPSAMDRRAPGDFVCPRLQLGRGVGADGVAGGVLPREHAFDRYAADSTLAQGPTQCVLGPTRTVDADDHPSHTACCRCLLQPGANDHDGTERMVYALFADRSDKETLEHADPSCPDDEEIGLSTGANQCHSWSTP